MTEHVAPSLHNPAVLLATWFGVGLLPKAPGTWGSLAALPFAWAITSGLGWPGLAAAILVVFFAGWWAAHRYVTISGIEDPGCVVIDEVAGQWLVLLLTPPDPILYAAGFVVFRLLDIIKPWPACWADRSMTGGLGVMLDDVLAGSYGLLAMLLVHFTWR
jgi:phosphatidylglycerophosphatase A